MSLTPHRIRFAPNLPASVWAWPPHMPSKRRVAFKLKNRSTKTLRPVTVSITYLDSEGTPIATDRQKDDDHLDAGDVRQIVFRVPNNKAIRGAQISIEAHRDRSIELELIMAAAALVFGLLQYFLS
ncbi:hypothetical protein C7S18_01050 [Ahniella affigens]|uniref:Uncharacterized protein n=1 Tax=Ahniella affigens TaxID=2021234 RepID=A0A2P1PM11_9GAMM|nr:hypothetical protein [Ahniella affigens]AVP95869.1 hypothetical protein C7S18_01050 [Ahniella affigens]